MSDKSKLDMQSPDIVSDNIDTIAKLFPNCVTEGREGKVIDFDLLKQELSKDIVSGNKERYRLEWPGKKEAIVTANIPTTRTLRPVRKDSVDFDNTENIYIEGDNLEVLKILQESYFGKIKMIYIDPPYNTGKDFVYKDNFKQSTEEYNDNSGQVNEENQRLFQNPESSGRYHSNWLSMIYPRLKLARNLLAKSGVIYISIDDKEVHNLRKISDEIFGVENFISNIIWHKKYAKQNDSKTLSISHDHILLYAKNKSEWIPGKVDRTEDKLKGFKNPDSDHRGRWQSVVYTCSKTKTQRPNLFYPITNPFTNKEVWPNENRVWAYERARTDRNINEDRLWWGKDGQLEKPRMKTFLEEVGRGIVPDTLWPRGEVGDTQESARQILELFGKPFFDTPKPTRLIQRCISIANCSKNDIILDFFSGSATSAVSVMELNSKDSGIRKHIQVQLPENTDKKSEAFKAGYKNICQIGKERIRRAAKKIKEETNAEIDYGFRVYRLDESNMQDVYYTPQDYDQQNLELFADNVKPDRTAEDLLIQVVLDWGLPLSLKIEKVDIEGKEVFKVAGNSLYACFDRGVDESFAKAIAKEKPLRIVFKDASFKDDTAKSNVKQLLKQLSPDTEMKVI